jgi:two-component sensor histidine kinase
MPIHGRRHASQDSARRAAAQAAASALPSDHILEALPAGVYTCRQDGLILRYNRRAAELWGQAPPLADPRCFFCGAYRAYSPEGTRLPPSEAPMREVLRSGLPIRDRELLFERPDGSRVAVIANLEPVRDGEGRIIGALGCLHDISALKRAQNALRAELNHRVKNALTSVQSLASQTIRGGGTIDGIRADFESRLFALNGAHTRLANSGWQAVELQALLHDALGAYQDEDGSRIVLGGEAAALPPKAAVAVAMIMHELAINAAKHGALSVPGGGVSVAWRFEQRDDERRLEIEWLERDGPPVAQPTHRGFGSRLIERAVVHELQGIAQLSYALDGVRCVMDFPLREGAP